MKNQDASLNCDEVRRRLIERPAAAPLPGQAEQHLRNCSDCQAFARALNSSIPAETPSPRVLREIEQGILADLRPVHPAAPTRNTFAVLLAIFVCLVAAAVSWLGASGLGVMSPLEAGVILGALAVGAGITASSLAGQTIPGSRYRIPPGPLPAGVVLSLAAAIGALFPLQEEQHFWAAAWVCIRRGTLVGILAGGLSWLVLRRFAVLSPIMTGATTGLLAGLAGESALQIYCPIMDVRHILAAHLGVAALCTLAGFVIGRLAEFKAVSRP